MNEGPQVKQIGSAARWLMPSLHSYAVLVVLFLLIHNSWRFLVDSDTGWHIRTGEWIWRMRSVPRHDLFSYTMQGHEWFAWEWLSDLLLAAAHYGRGLAGVVALAILVLLVTFAVLYRVMLWRGSDPLLALLLTSFAAVATIVHWLARPHLISMLLMIWWLALVERYRRTRTRWIYLLPFLVAIWANLHGAFVATFVILVIYAAGEAVEFALRGEARSRDLWRVLRTYALVGGLSFVAALATPYGVKLYGHLWRYLTDQALLAAINEFQSPDFHTTDGKIIEVLLFLAGVAAARALREGRIVELGLLLLLGHMTLQSERHVTLAAVVLTPIIAEQWTRLLSEWSALISGGEGGEGKIGRRWRAISDRYRNFRAIDQQLPGVIIYPIALTFLFVAVNGPWTERLLKPHFDASKFPVGAADFIAITKPTGNLYAHDQYGGYLIYRFYPEIKVFADGRSDLYRKGPVLDDMAKLFTVKSEWAEVLDRHRVDWMVLRRDEPLALLASMSGKWTNSYQDETAQIMIRKTPPP